MIECRACAAQLPLVWCVQSRRTMHQGPGLDVISCARVEDRDPRARDIANDRGNADPRDR